MINHVFYSVLEKRESESLWSDDTQIERQTTYFCRSIVAARKQATFAMLEIWSLVRHRATTSPRTGRLLNPSTQ
ncbi:hypothetical protein MPTK2_3g24260 [Marchantia polymorpha subsp. ruderalis]